MDYNRRIKALYAPFFCSVWNKYLKIQKMFESVPYVIELNKDYTRKEKK